MAKIRQGLDYLLKLEKSEHFMWGVAKKRSLFIACDGYKTALLYQIDSKLRSLGFKYDFELGMEVYDEVCGKTFIYYKNIYKNI